MELEAVVKEDIGDFERSALSFWSVCAVELLLILITILGLVQIDTSLGERMITS